MVVEGFEVTYLGPFPPLLFLDTTLWNLCSRFTSVMMTLLLQLLITTTSKTFVP